MSKRLVGTDRGYRRRRRSSSSSLAVVGKAWWDSRLPDTYSVMSYGTHDYGGGPVPADHEGTTADGASASPTCTGPDGATRRALRARPRRAADIHLASGRVVHALTFNGTSPGPELRVRQGDLVEVVLRNEDVEDGVTIHWHGVDVPNAEDGVAGVTQDAVLPGESYTYRFRAEQVGTFWYHTHQVSSEEVQARPLRRVRHRAARRSRPELDLALAAHTFDGVPTLERRTTASARRDGRSRHARPAPADQHGQLEQTVHRLAEHRSACSRSTAPTSTSRACSRTSRLPIAAGGRYRRRLRAADERRARRRSRARSCGDRARPERRGRHPAS